MLLKHLKYLTIRLLAISKLMSTNIAKVIIKQQLVLIQTFVLILFIAQFELALE